MKRITLFAVIASALAILGGTSAVFHLTQDAYKAYMLGRRHFDAGRYGEALPLLTRAHALEPGNREAARYLLWTFDKLGRQEDARSVLEKLVQQAPEDTASVLWLADLSAAVRDFARAEALYQKIITREPSPEIRRKLAEALAWQKKYAGALAELTLLRNEIPDNAASAELFADVSAWSGNYGQAIDAYRELLDRRDVDKRIYFKLAEALRFAGRNDEAVEMYRKYAAQ
ncbi:MAG: tetratricopeptide repeat protein [Deltaproteobacteria bacterium]|nr:tetratricopeptide repeat protein [Deltaproteobacteria bacterium]